MKTKVADYAVKRKDNSPLSSYQWFYGIDGRPECNGIAAAHYLKACGFSTEQAGAYMRELQGPQQPIPMSAEEARYFEK